MNRIAHLALTLAATLMVTGSASAAPVRTGERWSLDDGRYTVEFQACDGSLCARLVETTDAEARPVCGQLLLHSLKPEGDSLVGRYIDYEGGGEYEAVIMGAGDSVTVSFPESPTPLDLPLARVTGKPSAGARVCAP